MSEIAQTDNFNDKTNIKVVGVGGAGGNAVNRMIAEGLQSVEFIAINTDAKDLLRSDADVKISLNDASSRGLGAGADPEKGAKAAQDHQSDIEESLKGADMVFVTCGEGGGTGTGASPIVARAAHQQGALTIAVVTRPFSFEGPQRAASAALGIENLRKEVDALIVIPNDRLLELSDRTIGIVDAFKTADTALLAGVQGITDLITANSYIHVDFNDVNAILRGAGTALFGIGSARGEDRATQAAEIAISSPLLEENEGAHGALINIAGPTDIKLQEAAAATELVRKAIHPEAQIIWGLSLRRRLWRRGAHYRYRGGLRRQLQKDRAGRRRGQAATAGICHGAGFRVERRYSPAAAAGATSAGANSGGTAGAAAIELYSIHPGTRVPLSRSTRPPNMKWSPRTIRVISIFRISCARLDAYRRKEHSWQDS